MVKLINDNVMPSLGVECLTAPGRGAIAVIRLFGGESDALLAKVFTLGGKRLPTATDLARGKTEPLFGHFRLAYGATERHEEVVIHSPKPAVWEICCHGGDAVVRAILQVCVDFGACVVESSRKADGVHESFRETAARLLPFARTEWAAKILLDQYHGAAEDFLAEFAAAHDAVSRTPTREKFAQFRQVYRPRLQRIVDFAPLGAHLIRPWRVVLVGPVNAGKSSLVNGLLGIERVITDPSAGTTRDAVFVDTVFEGVPIELIDTAGFRTTSDDLERQGIALAERLAADADLVLYVCDMSESRHELEPNRYGPASSATGRAALTLLNKSDSVPQTFLPAENPLAGTENIIRTCAFDTELLSALRRRIVATLVPEFPLPGDVVPLTDESAEHFRTILEQLEVLR